MKFSPVKQKKISDIIYEQIKEMILDNNLPPGEKLPPERTLAAQLGVSRPSLREALQKLEIQGFLEQVQGGGTYVKSITTGNLENAFEEFIKQDDALGQLMEVRKILETWSARTAAERANEEEIAQMEEYLSQMKEALDDSKLGYVADANFHKVVSYSTHNLLLIHIMNSIYEWIEKISFEVRSKLFKDTAKFESLYNQHSAVFEAIKNRDADGAYEAMLVHMDYIIDEICEIVNS